MKKSIRVLAALGVVAAGSASLVPLSTYAVDNTATIQVTVSSTISMKINDSTSPITSTTTMSNDAIDESTISHAVNVATNNVLGYTLTVQDTDTDNSLKGSSTNSIPAVTGTTLTATTPAWGYRVQAPGESTPETDYHAVPTSNETAATLRTVSSVSEATFNETTTVKFGFATGSVPADSYSTTIKYVATGNTAA